MLLILLGNIIIKLTSIIFRLSLVISAVSNLSPSLKDFPAWKQLK